jgi:hypothetical protein
MMRQARYVADLTRDPMTLQANGDYASHVLRHG